jgi:hypothetical protein
VGLVRDATAQAVRRAIPFPAGQHSGEPAAILPVDPAPHLAPERFLQRGEPRRQDPDVTQVDLKVLQAGGPDQLEREPHDLHIRLERAVSQQLGADLEHLAGASAALGLLAVDLAGIAEPERQLRAGERG